MRFLWSSSSPENRSNRNLPICTKNKFTRKIVISTHQTLFVPQHFFFQPLVIMWRNEKQIISCYIRAFPCWVSMHAFRSWIPEPMQLSIHQDNQLQGLKGFRTWSHELQGPVAWLTPHPQLSYRERPFLTTLGIAINTTSVFSDYKKTNKVWGSNPNTGSSRHGSSSRADQEGICCRRPVKSA